MEIGGWVRKKDILSLRHDLPSPFGRRVGDEGEKEYYIRKTSPSRGGAEALRGGGVRENKNNYCPIIFLKISKVARISARAV